VSHLNRQSRTRHRRCALSCHLTRVARAKSTVAALATAFSLLTLGSPSVTFAQESVPSEYRSKASFLTTFPSFVDWPDGAFASSSAPFIVCVLGDFRFGTTLAEVSRESLPHGRRFSVRWVRNDQQLRGCHILFVSSSELPRYAKVIALVQGASTFTVGETAGFLAAGGMLSMSFEHEVIQFEINLASAKEAHFHVSSRLLALARHVVDSTESTKS
jgi:YfiR/HmsC-like